MAGRVSSSDWGPSATTMASSQMFYFLLVPLFVLWLFYFKLSRRNLNKHAAKIPGPPGYPIIGNLFDLMGSSHSEYSIFCFQDASFFLFFFWCFFFFSFLTNLKCVYFQQKCAIKRNSTHSRPWNESLLMIRFYYSVKKKLPCTCLRME